MADPTTIPLRDQNRISPSPHGARTEGATASLVDTFRMDIYPDRIEPPVLWEVAQEDVVVLTWHGDGTSITVETFQHTSEDDRPFELFKRGTGPHQNEYTVSSAGDPFTIKSDVPTGEYHVMAAKGIKGTIHVKRKSQKAIAITS